MIELLKYPVPNKPSVPSLHEKEKYTFHVDVRLSKTLIRKIFEKFLEKNTNMKLISINTQILPPKKKRVGFNQGFKTRYKRVILTTQPRNYKGPEKKGK